LVSQETDLTVVWGPAHKDSILGVPYSLAYIAMRTTPTLQYTIVIRGTDLISWDSWSKEDFDIKAPLVPFSKFDPMAPTDAMISQGTANGLQDLLDLVDPTTQKSMLEFLIEEKPPTLFVTGHSLGGTLTPPLAAYLTSVFYGGNADNVTAWTFAALTSGDEAFANYYNGLNDPSFLGRLHNTLDIAPFLWWSESDVENIYSSEKLEWKWPEDDFFEHLFSEAAGNGYTQPGNDQPLTGQFDSTYTKWIDQAFHQHHSATYQELVDALYPPIT